tara:strand:- start:422 stop:664 length:243 start_codon:yes stop_codon:yes gene_type:complete
MNDEQERFYKVLEEVIDDAFKKSWSSVGDKKKSKQSEALPIYEGIEDYKAQTGKRFRMTRDQKARGLSREDAFKEIWEKP